MTKPIEDSTNAASIRTALDVPTNAALNTVGDAAQAAAEAAATKYTKPGTGIPVSDLAADAQTSLGKADSAIQDLAGMTAKFNAGTAPEKAAFQASVSRDSIPRQLLAVTCGNSISQYGMYEDSGATWGMNARSEFACAGRLHPIAYRRLGVTPVTGVALVSGFVDKLGNYGFPSANIIGGSAQIIPDLQATWFPALDAANVVPELIEVTCTENDIGNGADTATVIARLQMLVEVLRSKFPGVLLHFTGPRADSRLTGGKELVSFAVRDWMVSTLDNGADIFVTDLWSGSYSNVAAPASPSPDYTDGVVHPNGAGAMLNGHLMAATNRRISARIPAIFGAIRGRNVALLGTVAVAASPAGYTGTVPTNVVTGASGDGVCTFTALNPGVRFSYTPTATKKIIPILITLSSSLPTVPVGEYVRVKIISGASNVHDIYGLLQLTGTPATLKISDRLPPPGAVAVSGYRDGQVLHLSSPMIALPATTFTGLTVAVYVSPLRAGEEIVVEIEAMNYVQ